MASDTHSPDSEAMASINIVPFVDIILVILIVFMVTSPFIVKPTKALDVPLASTAGQTAPEVLLRVKLLQNGDIFLNDKQVPVGQLQQQVQQMVRAQAFAPDGDGTGGEGGRGDTAGGDGASQLQDGDGANGVGVANRAQAVALRPPVKALVAAAAEASHGQVVQLIESLKAAGVHEVAIAVQGP